MPTATEGLLQVTLEGVYLGEEWALVWHYWDSAQTASKDLSTFATQFDTIVASQIPPVVGASCLFQRILVRDVLGIENDVEIVPSVGAGALGGDSLASWMAARIDMLGADKSTRRGYKRICGVTEGQASFQNLSATGLANFQTLEAPFLQQIIVGPVSYQPVIYGGPTPTNPTRSIANLVTSVSAQQRLTSQNTRK